MRFFLASGCPIATTTRYRCLHLREQLQMLGHEAEIAERFEEPSIDPGAALRHDIILLYRLRMSSPLADLIERARSAGKTIVFDTDDLIFEPELIAAQRGVHSDVGPILSLTNPAFVSLEMMACRCAMVEIASERFEGVLRHGRDAWLAEPTGVAIVEGI